MPNPRAAVSAMEYSPISSHVDRGSGPYGGNVPVLFLLLSSRIRSAAAALVAQRRRGEVTRPVLCPHEAFEFADRPVEGLLDGLAALGAARDHLGVDRLGGGLVADLRRRGSEGDRHDLPMLGWIVVERALGRAFIFPGLEVEQLRERRQVVAAARRDQLLDRGTLRQIGEQALAGRLVAREIPQAPVVGQAGGVTALRSGGRVKGPALLGALQGVPLGDPPGPRGAYSS